MGRLSPEKGPDVFARAAMLLRGLAPQVHCVMLGEGPIRAALVVLIRQLGLARRVHLLGVRADMPALYGELDAVMSASHSEAMPLALMEAMASGLPVIATRVGGVPDIVVQSQTGWLVNGGDAEALATHAALVLGDAPGAQAMGRRARERAVSHFNLEHSQARVEALMWRLAHRGVTGQGGSTASNGSIRPALRTPGPRQALPQSLSKGSSSV